MMIVEIEEMFHHLNFMIAGTKIKEKAKAKLEQLKAKLTERARRIAALRKQYKITDAVWVEILTQRSQSGNRQSYSVSNAFTSSAKRRGRVKEQLVPASGVGAILAEEEQIENEKKQVQRLELIIRNLKPETEHCLSFEELEYLGL